jgi:hypothetical protein
MKPQEVNGPLNQGLKARPNSAAGSIGTGFQPFEAADFADFLLTDDGLERPIRAPNRLSRLSIDTMESGINSVVLLQ